MTTVIRAGDVPGLSSRLTAVDLSDHFVEAKQLVARAQSHAERILDQARNEAARLGPQAQKNGYDAGYAEGSERGYAEGKGNGEKEGYENAYRDATQRFDEQHAAIVRNFERLADQLESQREALFVAAKRDLLDFAIGVATKLTYRIGSLDSQAAVANLDRSLQLVQSKRDLTVRAHPDDLAAIEEFASSALPRLRGEGGLMAIADASIDRGGCVVQHETGEVDATLSTQIDELVGLLLGDRTSVNDDTREGPADA